MNDPVDILIVGAGAAGGVLCKELAEAGFWVVVLEAGPHWVPERDFVSDEKGAHKLYWTDPRVTGGKDPIELGANGFKGSQLDVEDFAGTGQMTHDGYNGAEQSVFQ